MKNLLTLALLLIVSNLWAQDSAVSSSQTAAVETPIANVTVVVQGNSWGSSAAPAAGNSAGVQTPINNSVLQSSPVVTATIVSGGTAVTLSPTAMVSTPVAGTVSASATPSGTPAVMSKPPVLAVVTPVNTVTVGEHFVFQVDGGAVVPISNAAATYFSTGYNFDGRISYAFDDVFAIGLESGFYNLGVPSTSLTNSGIPSSAMASLTHIPLLFTMQIYFGDSGAPIQPYLLLAGGLAIDTENLQGTYFPVGTITSWTNFELAPAVGVAFRLDKNTNVFLQARLDMDFDNNNAGNGSETGDTPLIMVPIQLGANFNL